jgi:hypothetical protein
MKIILMNLWLTTLTLMLVLLLSVSVSMAQVSKAETDGQVPAEGSIIDSETPVGTPVNAAQQVKVDNLASAVAVAGGTQTSAEIESMRAEGMGWGEIAHEIGVHPSTLGRGRKVGHAKPNSGIEQGTARSMSGKAKGHGTANADGIGGIGAQKSKGAQGNSKSGIADSNKGRNSGNSGNSGNRGNIGNSVNSGKK